MAEVTAHSFSFPGLFGGEVRLADYAGKVLLIVNTASHCRYTPQYSGLEALWLENRGRGLVVIGVPSNDFGNQEPGTDSDIAMFCQSNYGISFPMTAKQSVIEPGAHPFYKWIAARLGEDRAPSWNFQKYLIGRDGRLIGTFPSKVAPNAGFLIQAINTALAERVR